MAQLCLSLTFRDHVGAQEPPPDLLSEPAAYTDVLDAFDGDDPFDIRVSWGYRTHNESGRVQRETVAGAADGRPRFVHVADAEHQTKTLSLQVEVGLFRDLSLTFGLPFVLEDDRSLRLPQGAAGNGERSKAIDDALSEPLPIEGPAQLFDLSDGGVRSQLRDGIPGVDVGLAWSPINQFRMRGMPTWTLRWDNRFGTNALMSPCLTGNGCSRGTSRGTWRTQLGSRWSYRYRLFEPLLGFSHAVEIVTTGDDNFEPVGPLPGDVDPQPPSETTLEGGVAVIPWEDRGRHQRLSISLLGSGTHISAGRDYSVLFDALGTSTHPYLNTDVPESTDEDARQVPFSGMTQVESHMRLGAELQLMIQAARYVRFTLGFGVGYVTPYLLTGASPCNDTVGGGEDDPRAGACAKGITNPSHRPVIDQPGRRFRLDGVLTLDLFAVAGGQF